VLRITDQEASYSVLALLSTRSRALDASAYSSFVCGGKDVYKSGRIDARLAALALRRAVEGSHDPHWDWGSYTPARGCGRRQILDDDIIVSSNRHSPRCTVFVSPTVAQEPGPKPCSTHKAHY
jgi:hypothetical protein